MCLEDCKNTSHYEYLSRLRRALVGTNKAAVNEATISMRRITSRYPSVERFENI